MLEALPALNPRPSHPVLGHFFLLLPGSPLFLMQINLKEQGEHQQKKIK